MKKLKITCFLAFLNTWKCQILQSKFPLNELLNLILVESSDKNISNDLQHIKIQISKCKKYIFLGPQVLEGHIMLAFVMSQAEISML